MMFSMPYGPTATTCRVSSGFTASSLFPRPYTRRTSPRSAVSFEVAVVTTCGVVQQTAGVQSPAVFLPAALNNESQPSASCAATDQQTQPVILFSDSSAIEQVLGGFQVACQQNPGMTPDGSLSA